MDNIVDLLSAQLKIEKSREQNIMTLKISLDEAIERKVFDIAEEDRVNAEMSKVRTQVKPGNISTQLDDLIVQKAKIAELEQGMLTDLKEFVQSAAKILDDTRSRSEMIETALGNVRRIDIAKSTYDFTELCTLELMWEEAAVSAEAENSKIIELKNKFDDELLNKVLILGEPVPDALKAALARLQIRKIGGKETGYALIKKVQKDINSMDEKELLGAAATALSKSALDSTRAGVYGVRAIVDTIQTTPAPGLMNAYKTESGVQATEALKESVNELAQSLKAMTALGRKTFEKYRQPEK